MLHFRIRTNPFQIQSVVNIHLILRCYKTLHLKHLIWGVNEVSNQYLLILSIFSNFREGTIFYLGFLVDGVRG